MTLEKQFTPPKCVPYSSSFNRPIDHFLRNITDKDRQPEFVKFKNTLGRKTIFGYVIPDFQRGNVWTDQQNHDLIDSIWRDIPIGSISINKDNMRRQPLHDDLKNILLDGQQRLTALKKYFNDQIEYGGFLWSHVPRMDQMSFEMSRTVQVYETSFTDRIACIEYYNRMNFGGTAHTENEKGL